MLHISTEMVTSAAKALNEAHAVGTSFLYSVTAGGCCLGREERRSDCVSVTAAVLCTSALAVRPQDSLVYAYLHTCFAKVLRRFFSTA